MSGHDHDVTVTQMYWQPALLRLTKVEHPDIDDGKGGPCFIAPHHITYIERSVVRMSKIDDPDAKHPALSCTAVVVSQTLVQYVTETPEQVALMRDRALGHESKPRSVE